MAVVGFDVGTYTSYIGVARAGGIETIANEYSDRATPTYISLCERSRSMGAASKQQVVTNFKNTVNGGFKRILGRTFKDPFVQREKNRYFLANDLKEDKDGNVLFQLSYMGEKQLFTAGQLMTMMLSKLKQTAETSLKTKVVDAVISVPVYFTDSERRALLDAAAAAGLNCLRLINDTTAAALGYGITKQDLPAENEKPRVVVFADLGYSALQVAACSFNKGKLKVLASSCDDGVGGRDFDEVLAKHFSAEFRTKYKVDAESHPKPYLRLLQECEKLKKLMSANTQAIPISIECFMDDKDVSSKMSRDDFEQLVAPQLQRMEACLQNVLTSAKLKPSDIHSVEVLGGSSRVPAFKTIVAKVFSKEPSTTLNADEAVARGCALQCAILSPTFRVRDFSITDCQLYPITLSWVPQNQMDEESRIEVFPQFHQIPSSKMLTFFRKEPFVLTAFYSNPANLPFPNAELGQWKVNNVGPQANGDSSKVKVKVRINGSGIFSVAGATMYEKIEGGDSDEKEEGMDVDNEKETSGTQVANGPNDEGAMQTDGSEKSPDGTNVDRSPKSPNQENSPTAENKEGDKDKGENKKGTKKNKVKAIELPIESTVPQISKEMLNLLIEKEGQMIMQDRLEKDKADAKNAVEEYVYEMRNKLGGAYEEYMQEDDRNSFLLKLEDTENWLYEEGEDQSKQVYVDRLSDLRKIGQPVSDRYREAEEWPEARDSFNRSLVHVRKFLDQYNAGDEKYDHLDKADVEKVQKCVDEKTAWWTPKMDAQNKIQKHENPVIFVSQVMSEKKAMESVCSPVMNKPKPKVEPPKEEKKEETSANNSGAGGDPTPQDSSANGAAAPADPQSKTGDMEID